MPIVATRSMPEPASGTVSTFPSRLDAQEIAEGSAMAAALNMPEVVRAWDAGHDAVCRDARHLVIAHAPAGLPSGSP